MSKNESAALSVKQWRAVRALLTRPTVAQAAQECGLSEATLYRWLNENPFRAALAQAEGEAVATVGRRLAALAEGALNELARAMVDPMTPAPTRVRAAESILANLLKFREIVGFEQRLTDLEKELRGG